MQTIDAPLALEWTVALAAAAGGATMAVVGAGYGLTNTSGVGAGFFPLVAGSLMALAGILWIVQLVATHRATAAVVLKNSEDLPPHHSSESALVALLDDDNSDEPDVDEFPDRAGWLRVGIVVGALLGGALLLPTLGYTLTMTLMLAIILFFVSKRNWWVALFVAIGAALISRLVFDVWLGTALPMSTIDFLAQLGL